MQSLIFANSFLGFVYNDEGVLAPGRNLVFFESENYWLETPHGGRFDGLDQNIVIVDIAACFNILPVLTEDLTPLQGFELVLIHELVHACMDEEPHERENHTAFWNNALLPIVQEYCTAFMTKDTQEIQ